MTFNFVQDFKHLSSRWQRTIEALKDTETNNLYWYYCHSKQTKKLSTI
uniref:Uncharacterized protein n=1 Tax=Arundo donax TaxID=35708 RepID=A0A0A9AGS9_ARUDO